MLLKDWIYKFHEKIYKGDLVWRTHAKDLHVIGECRNCEKWIENTLETNHTHKHDCVIREGEWHSHEGCSDWEKKDD